TATARSASVATISRMRCGSSSSTAARSPARSSARLPARAAEPASGRDAADADDVAHQPGRRGRESRTHEAPADLEASPCERREQLVRTGGAHALEAACRERIERAQKPPGDPLEVIAAARAQETADLVERALPFGDEVDRAEVEDGVEAAVG